MRKEYKKQHNSPQATWAKIQMRKNVLEHVSPARVFDAFCGHGEMFRGAWKEAASYIGVDKTWSPLDERRRFVADNMLVMRAVDLKAFNVFDFDAFGSPWDQMQILLARRPWAKGERGAVVLTDGGSMKTRFGEAARSQANLVGMSGKRGTLPPKQTSHDVLLRMAIKRWIHKAGVTPVKYWSLQYADRRQGNRSVMNYLAIVFDGIGKAPS